MTRSMLGAAFVAAAMMMGAAAAHGQPPAVGQQAYGYQWGSSYNGTDWNRFYHYPYVWYPHNFYADSYMQSTNDLYYRYPQEMRVPVYNRQWQNELPKPKRYYQGHHFHLDVF